MSRRLTTTSYALLGLLSIQPWSAYELTQQMRRSLHYVWPKSESLLYTEPRKLVDAGLATATERRNGARTSVEYRITPAGRKALSAWLETPPANPVLEFESMLRVTLADQDRPDQLARALRATAAWADGELRTVRPQLRDYLETGGPFPHRLHLIALLVGFYGGLFDHIRRFTSDAADLVDSWDNMPGPAAGAELRAMIEHTLSLTDGD